MRNKNLNQKIILDKKKINNFWENRTIIANRKKSTHFHNTYKYDFKLINKYVNKQSEVLDLGCGNCSLSNSIALHVKHIKAVDKYKKFLSFCNVNRKLEIYACDILDYKDVKKYDLILLFGVVNFFTKNEEIKLYKICKKLLNKNGKLIIKHQCGIEKEIIIDKYSTDLKDNYNARYPFIKDEISILKKYFDVKVVDIYPKKLNPWPNTHFYAFICAIS